MADTLLSSYPPRTLTYVLGHDSGDLVGKMAVTGVGGGATVSDTPPTVPAAGGFWYESDTGALHISYGGAWVQTTPTAAALSRTNDTNVTLTLTGTPGTALMQPVTMTLGWTGALSATRGGTGIASYTAGDLLYASSASVLTALPAVAAGKVLTSDGVGFPPIWDDPAGGAPGGSSGDLQFNNSSTFDGVSGSAVSANGSLALGGATVTASDPVLDLSQTWNAGGVTFTGIKTNVTNTASATASKLVDLQVGGTTMFGVRKDGNIYLQQSNNYVSGASDTNGFDFVGGAQFYYYNNTFMFTDATRAVVRVGLGGFAGGVEGVSVTNAGVIGFTAGAQAYSAPDTSLARAAAALMDVNNGSVGGVAYARLNGVAVASLPAASSTYLGARGTVNNSNATLTAGIGAVVAGGGSNIVPVFCDGTNWRIG